MVEAYALYKGSKKMFCREHGLAEHTLDYWRRKFTEQSPATSGFVALEVNAGEYGHRLEVHYPNGVRVVVPSAAPVGLLQSLIQLGN